MVGCADSGDEGTASGPTFEPGTTTGQTATETGGIDTLEGASTNPVTGPQTSRETALLRRVALGRNEGFDRIVFEFTNAVPGYRVEYVEPPIREDGSGNEVAVDGDVFVQIRMFPASGFDLNTAEGVLVYKGPRRFSGSDAGTSVLREAVRTGDFEAALTWVVGVGDRVDFRVLSLASPPRLVVDFRNH